MSQNKSKFKKKNHYFNIKIPSSINPNLNLNESSFLDCLNMRVHITWTNTLYTPPPTPLPSHTLLRSDYKSYKP